MQFSEGKEAILALGLFRAGMALRTCSRHALECLREVFWRPLGDLRDPIGTFFGLLGTTCGSLGITVASFSCCEPVRCAMCTRSSHALLQKRIKKLGLREMKVN